jgi:sialate O-acetylesterase
MKNIPFVHILALMLATISLSTRGEVRLHGLFTDGAVLQQNRDVPIWGTGREGEKVTVKFNGQEVSTTVQDGRWLVKLKPSKAGGPFVLTMIGDNTVTISNVLVGEVWLCSGQSNMGFQLYRAANGSEAIAAANDHELHLFTVPRKSADSPWSDINGNWKPSTPDSASNFSAVAYFFGRDLRRALKVPIGLIDSSVGGTPAEAWTSRGTLESDPELKKILSRHQASVETYDQAAAEEKYKLDSERYKEAARQAKADGKPAPRAPAKPTNPATGSRRPSGLYNAMIAPLQPYAIAGAIWYQGEANSGRGAEYQTLFPAMIRNWREAWGQGDFPFLFVQIAPNSGMSPEIREAQLLAWQKVPRTAMVVTVDVGEANDIHPTNKEPVGTRLALAARAIAYGEKIEYSGPVFEKMSVKGGLARLRFTHLDGGLVAEGGALKGFSISADGEHFVDAQAAIKGREIEVSSKEVAKPVAVRYGWDRVPDVNLFNKQGLPASPFRTDSKQGGLPAR